MITVQTETMIITRMKNWREIKIIIDFAKGAVITNNEINQKKINSM